MKIGTHKQVSVERLKEVLSYNRDTGVFIWKKKTAPRCNRINPGAVAGTSDRGGYRLISIDGCTYKAHRLAWLYETGEMPSLYIDHINGCTDDNRISNLREATPSENQQNRSAAPINNKSCGLLGATKSGSKWLAQIGHKGKNINLGLFDSAKEAHEAYMAAKKLIHPFGEIARG